MPPSFPSATLEIYYADSGGAAGRGEELVGDDGSSGRRSGRCAGGCGNLKLYLPYASNDFSPFFVPLSVILFSSSWLLHPPDVCADLHSRYSVLIYLYELSYG